MPPSASATQRAPCPSRPTATWRQAHPAAPGVALVLLFIFTESQWVILVFPAWVFMVSVYILVARLAGGRPAARDHALQPPD